MPRDEWLNAKRKDIARHVRPRYGKQGGNRKGKRHQRPTNAWNPNSVLWFGKYADTPIKDVPVGYLRWLAEQPTPTSKFMMGLCDYLRRYLA
jgi:hypothetical protein